MRCYMKKFIQKILFFSAFCAIFMVIIPIYIDPYNVFHINNVRDNGIEPNANIIKMNKILNEPDKYNAYLFGSSRVGAIHTENISDVNCYNMTYSEGLPQEHLDNIKTFIENDIIPKRIYLGVDSLSYTMSAKEHQGEHSRISYEYAKANPIDFLSLYLDPYTALKSLSITNAYTPTNITTTKHTEYGWWCEYGRESLISKENAPTILGDYLLMDECLNTIAEIVNICNENNIELIVFTNPMHYIAHYASWIHYEEFLIRLAAITDYYNFSSLNDITLNHNCYVDTSHYNAETGDLILEFLSGNIPNTDLLTQGFGVYVTNDNVDELIALLTKQITKQ